MNNMKVEKASTGALRNVLALGLVSFFTDVSSDMCFSLLPDFILGLPGGTRAILGVVEGLAEGLSYSLRSVSGVLSDMFRRRKVMVLVGYALSTVVKPLFAVARTPIDVLMVRVGDRVGKGIRTSPRDALLSESVSERRTGLAFGLHRALDQLGAILGPLLSSALMFFLNLTIREIFWVSFIPGFLAVLILVIFVKERMGKRRGERLLIGVKTVLKGRFLLLLFIVGIFSIGAFNYSFVLLKARDVGILETQVPIVYSVIQVAHAAIAIPAGLLSDKIGREKVLVMGYVTFLLSVFFLSLSFESFFYALLVAAVYGAYLGIVETVQRALVPGYAHGDLRSTAYGLYYLVVGASFLVANTVVGALWEYVNLRAAASYSIVTSILATVGMIVLLKIRRT